MLKLARIITMLSLVLLLGLLSACSAGQTTKQPGGRGPGSQPAPGGAPAAGAKPVEVKMPEEALYVCQTTRNQVAVIDLRTGEIVKEIPVGARPMALIKSPDNRYVFVANSGSGDVYMINTNNGEIDSEIPMGNQPVAMVTNKAGDKLYTLDYYLNRVSVIDLKLRSMVSFYPLNTFGFEERIKPADCCSDIFGEPMGAGRKPSALALDEAKGLIYVGNMGTYDVAVIDLKEEKEVETFDAAFGINDIFLAGGEKVFVSAAGSEIDINDSILTLDLKGGGSIDRLKVGVKPVSMTLSPDGKTIYVVTQNDTKLAGLNVTDGKIIGQCLLEGEPGDIVLSEDGSKAYIANLLNGTVFIVDTNTYSIIGTIEAGVTPKALVHVK